MALFTQSFIDSHNGNTTATNSKQSGCFDRWKRFLDGIGVVDEFLSDFQQTTRIRLISAFATSVRRNEYGKQDKLELRHGTVSSTVSNICTTFRTNFRDNPSLEPVSEIKSIFLSRLLRGYKLQDSPTKHQKCLPISVFKMMWSNQQTETSLAIGQLVCLAVFFGMRSCEYSTVQGDRKTKILRLCDFVFRYKKRIIAITLANLFQLEHATSVSITFHRQKNDVKEDTVTMPATFKMIGPVKASAAIVSRILQYPGTTVESPVNVVRMGKVNAKITSKQISILLKASVDVIGEDHLGFKSEDIGTHSIRSSFAMLLYLSKVPTYTIMLLGRWCSDAFLLYI